MGAVEFAGGCKVTVYYCTCTLSVARVHLAWLRSRGRARDDESPLRLAKKKPFSAGGPAMRVWSSIRGVSVLEAAYKSARGGTRVTVVPLASSDICERKKSAPVLMCNNNGLDQ